MRSEPGWGLRRSPGRPGGDAAAERSRGAAAGPGRRWAPLGAEPLEARGHRGAMLRFPLAESGARSCALSAA